MKDLKLTEIVKKFRFEGVWHKLESKGAFQGQSVTGYLGLILVFVWGGALRGGGGGGLIVIFRGFFG